MAYSTTNRSLCKACGKAPSIFFCQGCRKDFCTTHAKEHRQDLSKQLETIIVGHDQLKQNLTEYTEKSSLHPFVKEIDRWETQSMEKIREVAIDARKQLLNAINSHTTKVTEEVKHLTQELTKARSEDNFIEIDLAEWTEKLEKWTKDLNTPSSINIQQDESGTPFIRKIIVGIKNNKMFERSAGNIQIGDDGRTVIAGLTGHSTARCQGDYSSGQHKFRLKIEQMHQSNWMYFGIVSKDAPLQVYSYNTPTTFGWTTHGYTILNASAQENYKGYTSNVKQDDTLELLLDCDRRTICLTNERTNKKHELDIDVVAYPFPWQLIIGLQYQYDRIRLLPD
jgi:hypothetical protein